MKLNTGGLPCQNSFCLATQLRFTLKALGLSDLHFVRVRTQLRQATKGDYGSTKERKNTKQF